MGSVVECCCVDSYPYEQNIPLEKKKTQNDQSSFDDVKTGNTDGDTFEAPTENLQD